MRQLFAVIWISLWVVGNATAEVEWFVVPLDASGLGDFVSQDLQLTTTSDWTTASLLIKGRQIAELELNTGAVYQDPGGTNPPTAAQRAMSTDLEFDTAFGIEDDAISAPGNFSDGVAGAAGDLGADPMVKQTDSDGINIAWFNTDNSDTGTSIVARVTLSDDAMGIWRFAATEALEPLSFFFGTVFAGELQGLQIGDANNDGLVTGADLISVQQEFGSVDQILPEAPPGEPVRPATGQLPGDANDDGLVTGADLISVQQEFGNTLASGLAPGLPEPTTGCLWGLLVGGFIVRRPTKR